MLLLSMLFSRAYVCLFDIYNKNSLPHYNELYRTVKSGRKKFKDVEFYFRASINKSKIRYTE